MPDDYMNTAIAFGDLKNASLYFDHLVPIALFEELAGEKEMEQTNRVALAIRNADLVPPDLKECPGFLEELLEVNDASANYILKEGTKRYSLEQRIKGLSKEEFAAIEHVWTARYIELFLRYGLFRYPIVSASPDANGSGSMTPGADVSPILTLANLSVIDASQATWEHIAELRGDPDARRRLRRLRLFAYDNYSGKSPAYIEDDLLTKVADYDETVKQWGFETVKGAIALVLNSRLSATTAAGAILSTLFGHPAEAMAVAAAAASVQMGRVALHLAERRFALQELVRDSPVSYITYSRKKLRIPEGE